MSIFLDELPKNLHIRVGKGKKWCGSFGTSTNDYVHAVHVCAVGRRTVEYFWRHLVVA